MIVVQDTPTTRFVVLGHIGNNMVFVPPLHSTMVNFTIGSSNTIPTRANFDFVVLTKLSGRNIYDIRTVSHKAMEAVPNEPTLNTSTLKFSEQNVAGMRTPSAKIDVFWKLSPLLVKCFSLTTNGPRDLQNSRKIFHR
jgi:hypothetical protein